MKKLKRGLIGTLLLYLNIVIIIAGLAGTGYYYYRYHKVNTDYKKLKNTPVADLVKQAGDNEQSQLIKEVGALYNLPKDETPIIAQVTNKNDLKDPFYKNAENGDKVLFYKGAKLAFLYRPSTNKLINVSTLNVTASKTVTNIIGATADVESVATVLSSKFPNDITIGTKGPSKSIYASVVVVDLTGKNADLAGKIATELKGKVGSLPDGEDKPANTDILIIAAPII